MADGNVPNWKYWHPLSLWKVLLIFLIAQLLTQLPLAILFAVIGWSGSLAPTIGGGLGALAGIFYVQKLVKQAKDDDAKEASS